MASGRAAGVTGEGREWTAYELFVGLRMNLTPVQQAQRNGPPRRQLPVVARGQTDQARAPSRPAATGCLATGLPLCAAVSASASSAITVSSISRPAACAARITRTTRW